LYEKINPAELFETITATRGGKFGEGVEVKAGEKSTIPVRGKSAWEGETSGKS